MNKNASGPAIKVHFFCFDGKIERITLEESNSSTEWEIISEVNHPHLESLIHEWMNAYCSKIQPIQNIPLNINWLPQFSQKVLRTIEKLPLGKILPYQDVASLIGHPKAFRAVGNACGKNPFPLIIPCHRVVGKESVGGYAFGIPIKESLLKFERF